MGEIEKAISSLKLTICTSKMDGWKTSFPLGFLGYHLVRYYVSFREGTIPETKDLHEKKIVVGRLLRPFGKAYIEVPC